MYWEYYLMGIILLPALILAVWAQARVTTNFNKYNKVISSRGMKACEVARLILDAAGLKYVKVISTEGHLTDHYDPKSQVVALSTEVYNSTSVAAIGIASHEVGHAIQHAQNYTPIKIRSVLVKVSNISSALLWPLVILGLILNFGVGTIFGNVCLWAGIIIFGVAMLFEMVTLPVEYNASKRAKQILSDSELLDSAEMVGVNKVLNAAALTYVASMLVAMLNFLRFLIVMFASNRD